MNTGSDSRLVLAIGAHPDDIEFLCAGTLALLKQRGWRVVMATMTPGDLGSATLPREEIARVRVQEAHNSATILEAKYYCLDAADFMVFLADELCRRVTGLIRAVRPDLVLTHSLRDYLSDHEQTAQLVRGACFAAPVRNYETTDFAGGAVPTEHIPHLYYCDSIEGIDIYGHWLEASLIVDISAMIETKQRMLTQHASQRDWLRAQHGCDEYVDLMRNWSRKRGQQIGCAFGEAFRQHTGHAYPQDDLLRETLGDLAHVIP